MRSVGLSSRFPLPAITYCATRHTLSLRLQSEPCPNLTLQQPEIVKLRFDTKYIKRPNSSNHVSCQVHVQANPLVGSKNKVGLLRSGISIELFAIVDMIDTPATIASPRHSLMQEYFSNTQSLDEVRRLSLCIYMLQNLTQTTTYWYIATFKPRGSQGSHHAVQELQTQTFGLGTRYIQCPSAQRLDTSKLDQ